MLLEALGKSAEAIKEYEHALALDPNAAVSANNLAWLYAASNTNLDQALQLAQAAHQVLPDETQVSDTLGWVYVRKNMGTAAIPHLESCVRKTPNDPVFQSHLGVAYFQAGDFAKARVALTKALSIKPDFDGAADARKALATIGA